MIYIKNLLLNLVRGFFYGIHQNYGTLIILNFELSIKSQTLPSFGFIKNSIIVY